MFKKINYYVNPRLDMLVWRIENIGDKKYLKRHFS